MKSKFLLFLILLIINRANSQIHYYVSVTGNDNNNGSISSPFQSIKKARDFLRNKTNPMTQDIIVHILGGTYILNETLEFNNADSGNNGHFIVYQGEVTDTDRTIISGGKTVTGWSQVGTNNIYQANIGNLYSRQLYINGNKAIRAKSENNMGLIETSKGYFSPCTDFSNWKNLKDVEIASDMFWKSYRIPVDTICDKQLLINSNFWINQVHPPTESESTYYFKAAPVKWIENAFELLDKPNEWYIDKSTKKVYIVSNVTLGDVIIPNLETLIKGSNVNNMKFSNLIFNYSNWDKPSQINNTLNSNFGFCTEQADWYSVIGTPNPEYNLTPAAISFENSNHIYINNNEFMHMGATALSFGENSNYNVICGNRFEDISASAIRVGSIDPTKINTTVNNVIINNTIKNIGNEYFGSIGIFVPYAKNTTIEHNTLSEFPYSGISVGWGWSRNVNMGKNNINYNKIDCTKQILPDSGGIYTLSEQGSITDRTQIVGNYILNQKYYLGGIYMDNSSSFMNIKDNVIDTNEDFTIPSQIFCVNNNIKSIVFYYRSSYITITNNFYKDSYSPPPKDESECYEDYPCDNIIVSGNQEFTSISQDINKIINFSGVQSNNNCN